MRCPQRSHGRLARDPFVATLPAAEQEGPRMGTAAEATLGAHSEVGTLRSAARTGRGRDLRGGRRHTDEIYGRARAGRKRLVGVDCVIDEDLAAAVLAVDLGADVLAIVTDVDAVYTGWGTPDQEPILRASPAEVDAAQFAVGSMGPKVRAACRFVEQTGGRAAIGSIHETAALVHGEAGTVVSREGARMETAGRPGR
jgi:Amino acid kinase family